MLLYFCNRGQRTKLCSFHDERSVARRTFATIVIMLFYAAFALRLSQLYPFRYRFALRFLLSKSGVTLNILTLGGVAVAIGRLVDDSIVVIENIFRKMQKKSFRLD